jgi:hypothetical protein
MPGQRLLRRDTDAAPLLQVVKDPPPPLASVRPDLPAELGECIGKALQTDPARRYATAEQFRAQLLVAWRTASELADHSDVRAHVLAAAGTKFRDRRARVAEVVELREQLARVGDQAALEVRESAGSSDNVVTPLSVATRRLRNTPPANGIALSPGATADRLRLDAPDPLLESSPKPTRSRARLIAVALPTAAVGVFLILASSQLQPAARGEQAPAPIVSAGATSALPIVPSAAPEQTRTATAPEHPTAEPARLQISSNVEIASLRLDSRDVPLGQPALRLDVPLTPNEARRTLTVVAISEDGRKTTIAVDATKAAPLAIQFPKRKTKSRAKRLRTETRPGPPPIIR